MPRKKETSGPVWQVVLEDIRSQNRLTIEAVEATRESLEQKIDDLGQRVTSVDRRGDVFEVKLADLDRRFDGLDRKVDGLDRKVDALDQKVQGLDEKVEGLDQKVDRIDRETRLRDAAIEGGLRELRVEFGKGRVDVRLDEPGGAGHRAREAAGLKEGLTRRRCVGRLLGAI